MANIQYFTQEEVDSWVSPDLPDHPRFDNQLGNTYDELEVIKYYGKRSGQKDHFWFCRCSCGNIVLKSTSSLKTRYNGLKRCYTCTRLSDSEERWEGFLKRFKKVHGDKYDYSKVNFKSGKDKIKIICPIHGEFEQAADSHASGKECNQCGRLKANASHRNDFSVFIERSKAVHGDFYNYDKVDYISQCKKVTITCPKHGDFEQIPKGHWSGRGCPVCRYEKVSLKNRMSQEDFISKCKSVHDNYYDYSKTEYTVGEEYITVTCPIHGDFQQCARIHVLGFGCSQCSTRGYNAEGGGYFYITALNDEVIKYGITSKDPMKRLAEHSIKSSFYHELLYSFFFEDGYAPKIIEKYVKENIGKKFVNKDQLPDGYTETCSMDKLQEILDVVHEYGGIADELHV